MDDTERIDRLERQQRFHKSVSGILCIVLAAFIVLGAEDDGINELRVQRLVLVDDAGREVISMGGADLDRNKDTPWEGYILISSGDDMSHIWLTAGNDGKASAKFVEHPPDEFLHRTTEVTPRSFAIRSRRGISGTTTNAEIALVGNGAQLTLVDAEGVRHSTPKTQGTGAVCGVDCR